MKDGHMLKQLKVPMLKLSYQGTVWDRASLGTRSGRAPQGGRTRQPIPSHCPSQGAGQAGGSPTGQVPPSGQGWDKAGLGCQTMWGAGNLKLF